jgi:hypothetical protein
MKNCQISRDLPLTRTRVSDSPRIFAAVGLPDALYPAAIACSGQNFAYCIGKTLPQNPCFHFSIMNKADNTLETPWPVKSFSLLHRAAFFYGR